MHGPGIGALAEVEALTCGCIGIHEEVACGARGREGDAVGEPEGFGREIDGRGQGDGGITGDAVAVCDGDLICCACQGTACEGIRAGLDDEAICVEGGKCCEGCVVGLDVGADGQAESCALGRCCGGSEKRPADAVAGDFFDDPCPCRAASEKLVGGRDVLDLGVGDRSCVHRPGRAGRRYGDVAFVAVRDGDTTPETIALHGPCVWRLA